MTGSDLRSQGAGLRIVPAAQAVPEALALADRIAEGPRAALIELKRHMRRVGLAAGILPAHESRLRAVAEPAAPPLANPSRPSKKIPLAGAIIELESFDDGVVVVHMGDRDTKNAFSDAFSRAITEAFATIRRTPEWKVVVLTGCDGYFASGGTRDGLASLQRGETRFTDSKIYSLPLACELPVIAAMQGHAIGAGWALGMFCDIALLGAERVYHSNYLRFGFTPGAGATLVLPDRLGDDFGREVLFSASEYKGHELAERRADLLVAPAADVLPRALAMAHRLAAKPRAWLMAEKARLAGDLSGLVDDVFARELAMHAKTLVGNQRVLERIQQLLPEAPDRSAAVSTPDPSVGSGAAHREMVHQAMIAMLAEELMIGAEEIRETSNFLDLGLDSILAVTWIRRLNARFGIELPATAVYAHPAVGSLIDHVASLVPAETENARPLPAAEPAAPAVANPVVGRGAAHRETVRRAMIAMLAEELMIGAEEIRETSNFLDLGLDSILAVTWIRRLNTRFGIELPATAVYAHPAVGSLIDHVASLVPAEAEPVPAAEPAAPVAREPLVAPQPSGETRPLPVPPPHAVRHAHSDTAIAIIGASGRFPKAGNLEMFWDNIRSGRDCVDEVPPERWDITRDYDPDPPDARKNLLQVDGQHRRRGPVRPALFQYHAPRSGIDGPATTAVPAARVAGIRGCGAGPPAAGGRAVRRVCRQRAKRLRRPHQRAQFV